MQGVTSKRDFLKGWIFLCVMKSRTKWGQTRGIKIRFWIAKTYAKFLFLSSICRSFHFITLLWFAFLSIFHSLQLFFFQSAPQATWNKIIREQNKLYKTILLKKDRIARMCICLCVCLRKSEESGSQTMTLFNTSSTPDGFSCHLHKQVLPWEQLTAETSSLSAGCTVWHT